MEADNTARDDLASGSERGRVLVDVPASLDIDRIDRQGTVPNREANAEHSPPLRKPVKLSREEYTVGWICAITVELVAAEAFLDETHANLEYRDKNDDNIYLLGKFGEHNTVIATLPEGEYGTNSAARVASDMVRSFPNIRFGLMVGVGGGAPSKQHDIRLGDIVVSSPRDGYPGVFQYDFGKSVQDEVFHATGFLNAPPRLLRAAVTALKAQYDKDDSQLRNIIDTVLRTHPELWKGGHKRPETTSDILYRPDFVHRSNDGGDCKDCCGLESKVLMPRQTRPFNDRPVIHYGMIASGNSLIKDAKLRDKLGTEKKILCFEMEAAGLMNGFNCLVIRGICDYSDSHKNNIWQPYAAVAAAAYSKDLLLRIPPEEIRTVQKANELFSEIQNCHQIFRLKTRDKDSTYEWYKGRIEKRVEGTCSWFLHHTSFKNWQQEESGPLLVSADPGCGKSVLTKYLVDEVLPGSATICYFFFKDQDQNTIRQALCALLHQLFTWNPALIEHALELFRRNGEGLVNNKASLWHILQAAVEDPRAGPIVLVFDALDECIESEFAELMEMIIKQLCGVKKPQSKLKYLLTSRPYEQIVAEFRPLLDQFPFIHIPGEDESEAISKEVDLVISHQVDQLSKVKKLSLDIKTTLERKFQEIPHRTYLWVHLVCDVLRRETIKRTPNAYRNIISKLPQNVNEAYEQILNRSENPSMARKALAIILAANRPLTVSEMNSAMNIDNESTSFISLDLEADEDFRSTFRSWCGLFVSIHHDKIYFLHQTAREFLVKTPSRDPLSTMKWHRSISYEDAHGVLAELCVRYLSFFNCMVDVRQQGAHVRHSLAYAAQFWADHFRKAEHVFDTEFLPLVLGICHPGSNAYQKWVKNFLKDDFPSGPNATKLMIASHLGHWTVARFLINKGVGVEFKDDKYGRTALSLAVERGHKAVARLLIDKGAYLDSQDKNGQTPLSLAAERGHDTVVKLLVDRGADLELKSANSLTPLSWAAHSGYKTIVELLIDKGANLESQDNNGQTPLSLAAERGYEFIVKLLIDRGAELESKDDECGRTPLSWAVCRGHKAIFKLLIDRGADVDLESKDTIWGQTPLSLAAERGHEFIVRLLIDKGAELESKDDEWGRTPLLWAAERGHEAVARLLIDKGADLESRDDKWGQTPLSWAAYTGHKAVTRLLIDKGANLESKDDRWDQTPLSWAVRRGHEAVIELLIDDGADLESKDDKRGQTPLLWAVRRGHTAIVKLLTDKGADIEANDRSGRTPLWLAASHGHKATVAQLLEKRCTVDVKDENGITPLAEARIKGYWDIVELLLKADAGTNDGGSSR
ncbi:unnamed protein product [Clonostachys byssicola]|uniref:Ankyrin repeat domain-containing protein 50 n=1 Tax=Clonostachys byssicola TaxID=160290 RepID=A0A9N9UHG2_9HYPO|nr:unnamed protein product [Clonostachys byssicola]